MEGEGSFQIKTKDFKLPASVKSRLPQLISQCTFNTESSGQVN